MTLYTFSSEACKQVVRGGAICPTIIRHYPTRKANNESKTIALGIDWLRYLRRINTLKAYKHIIDKAWGPSKGINKQGKLIFISLLYPGPDNFVNVLEVVGAWARIETLPVDRIPDGSITHETHPWLIHRVYMMNGKGEWRTPSNSPNVPIISNGWVQLKFLQKVE